MKEMLLVKMEFSGMASVNERAVALEPASSAWVPAIAVALLVEMV